MKFDFQGIETDPDYAALSANRDARTAERAAIRAEQEPLAVSLRSDVPVVPVKTNPIIALALGKQPETKESRSDREKRLGTLNKNLRDLDEAIDFLSARMREAANRHSIKVCAALKPQHDTLVRDLAKSIAGAKEASDRVEAFKETLTQAGINVQYFPDIMPGFLEAKGRYGRMAAWFDDLAKTGIIGQRDIPTDLDLRR